MVFCGQAARASFRERPKSPADEPRLLVARFQVRYEFKHDNLPPVADINEVLVRLHSVAGGYTAAEPDGPGTPFEVNDRDLRDRHFSVNAIKAMQEGIRKYLSDQGLVAVLVYAADPDSDPANPSPLNYAGHEDNSIGIVVPLEVVVGIVKEVRAVPPPGPRVTILPTQQFMANQIKRNSPVQPGQPIYKDDVQDYLNRVNRSPGTHVESAISAAGGGADDQVNLDYLVHQPKPWTVYVQGSNTGTKDTSVWQERFGFNDTNLLGFNDTLSVDYISASFRNTDTLTASYDMPIFDMTRAHARIYGTIDRFTASDVGEPDENLKGDGQEFGGEGVLNLYQYHDLFIDGVAGIRNDNYFVETKPPPTAAGLSAPIDGDGSFLFPYFGARLNQQTPTQVSRVDLTYEFNPIVPDSPDRTNLEDLGRLNANRRYQIIQGSALETFYIEPLLPGWSERDTQARPTAANEMAFTARGQFATSDKVLVPELEETAGGLYSVRGYPESVTAGDSVIVGSVEYRLHLPRLLGMASSNHLLGYQVPPPPLMGGSFQYQPGAIDTPGDYDLIGKLFIDGGYVHTNGHSDVPTGTVDHVNGEVDNYLIGVGPGLELQIRDNLNIQVDYGVALTKVKGTVDNQPNEDEVSRGSGRFNLIFTFVY
jgi:Haemolysin secretion/activation protein ShlB/FhaC/HecB